MEIFERTSQKYYPILAFEKAFWIMELGIQKSMAESESFLILFLILIGTSLCQSLAEPSFCTWYMSKYREGYFGKVTNFWYSLGQR